jgi:hypothetical protein
VALPVLVEVVEVVEVAEAEVDGEAVVVVLEATAPNLYMSSLFGPPQYSDELPLQGILHPVKPSGAGPPPLEKALPQSMNKGRLERHDGSRREHTALPSVFDTCKDIARRIACGCTKSHGQGSPPTWCANAIRERARPNRVPAIPLRQYR